MSPETVTSTSCTVAKPRREDRIRDASARPSYVYATVAVACVIPASDSEKLPVIGSDGFRTLVTRPTTDRLGEKRPRRCVEIRSGGHGLTVVLPLTNRGLHRNSIAIDMKPLTVRSDASVVIPKLLQPLTTSRRADVRPDTAPVGEMVKLYVPASPPIRSRTPPVVRLRSMRCTWRSRTDEKTARCRSLTLWYCGLTLLAGAPRISTAA
mmetsp:Transcript_24314/g.72667  ORF Transcript_24314/g.72667 Transcript_24314/m.72667 type:complete len:209 (-) Transcript_24314:1679-2305(-)